MFLQRKRTFLLYEGAETGNFLTFAISKQTYVSTKQHHKLNRYE